MNQSKSAVIIRNQLEWTSVLGHSNLDSTVRYLGVELDDALEVAENTVVDYCEVIKHLFFNRCLIF